MTPAEHRMKAHRFEEQELWGDAAKAWRGAIEALRPMKGQVVSAMVYEFHARAVAAEVRADEPMALIQPVHVVEAHAKMADKEGEDRDPGAVTHLEAGKTEGDTGAR